MHSSSDRAGSPDRSRPRDYAWPLVLVGAATALGKLGSAHLAAEDLVMLYLLVIGVTAARFGRGPSLAASGLSILAYDFFFVPPFYTFAVREERHLLTFATMCLVGLAISGLTLRIRRQEYESRERGERTAALYAASRELGSALDERDIARVVARHAAATFASAVVVLLPDAAGAALEVAASSGRELELGPDEARLARLAHDHGRPVGFDGGAAGTGGIACVPLRSGEVRAGVLAFTPETSWPPGPELRGFVDAFVRQAALALSRARSARAAESAALRARTEEMRSSLLSAVSHDLRTPLASITGAATVLREGLSSVDASQRAELVEAICDEAERLEHLVQNLLDMTRLESGSLQVEREWVLLEEIVGSALNRLEAQLAGRPIDIDLAPELPLLSGDPVLLEQVFVNLLENASKYTPAGSALEISARASGAVLRVEVADRGPGLPPGRESIVFERFQRGRHPGVPGAGLGLAICQGIVHAHGGELSAENRAGGGVSFRFDLPLAADAPSAAPGSFEIGATDCEDAR